MENPTPKVHYIHRLSYTRQERLVGAFVLLALAVIVGLIFVNSRTANFFASSVTFHAYLHSAEGITADTIVKVSGLEVGRVSEIVIADDNRIHIAFRVQERYRDLVRADSKASISKLSVFGKSTIEIKAGSPTSPVLDADAVLEVEEPMSMDQLIAELTPVVQNVSNTLERLGQVAAQVEPKRVGQSLRDLEATAANMRHITEQIASGKGAVGSLVASPEMEKQLRDSITELRLAMTEARARLAEIEPIVKDARGITADTKRVTEDLPDLVARMRLLTEQTERTMDSVMHTWPISSATPAPGPTELEVQQVQ